MFSSNTDSLGYQSFKGVSWTLVLGQHLGDTIKVLLLVLGPFLLPMFGLVSWACAPIISNPITNNHVFSHFDKDLIQSLTLYYFTTSSIILIEI